MLVIALTWLVNIPSHIFPCSSTLLQLPKSAGSAAQIQPRLSGAYSATLTALLCQIWVKHLCNMPQHLKFLPYKMASQINTTDYTYPYVTHTDQDSTNKF